MRLKYRKDVKHCPRCNERALLSQTKCRECGLVYARVENATNAEAKRQFFKKDRAMLMVTKTPKDVSRVKLALLGGFLGAFGAHNFYVGRYYKAIFMLLVSLLVLVYVSLPFSNVMLYIMSSPFVVIPSAIVAIFWVIDFVQIVFEKYKIPVAIRREG